MVLSHSVGRLLEPKFIEELKVLAGALTSSDLEVKISKFASHGWSYDLVDRQKEGISCLKRWI